ncbi:ankyrin repeat domain-containing protein SOWAHA-like isoform X4 [Mauremys reevesii]|uniref:ankyrin repeat domain-containing protein SOWAHA-like isoform X4 n=1 Tax=Mauremys reevesii TaxID=260615 RepID=UPI00193FCE5C|nr:ankyrin repeat domain-containing protein SOWAHA-like isoform X4 [Mauremys reevesii]
MAPVQGVTLNPVLPPPPGSCQLASLGGALGGVPVWKSARGDRAVCDPSQASPPLQHSLQENPCSQGVLAAPFCPGEKLPAGRDVPGAVAALPGSGAWPGPPAGMALWEGPRAGPEEGPALPHILVTDFSASSTAAWGSLEGVTATALNPQPEPEPPGAAEEDAESVSKPESEQDASEDGGSSLGSSSVALDPVEKEWLQGAASGHLLTLSHLLKQEPSLATRKDFTSGFTALHWAAKHGQEDLASLLVAAGADVNSRSGYTPLHIAALHGHRQVMELLVRSYGAKQNVRDYSGHLARHYLGAEKPLDRAATLPQLPAARGRNRALACLLLPKGSGQARKRWGSAEDLTEEEERGQAQHLAVPASYRAVRKFSR